jgi:hypothetical protein
MSQDRYTRPSSPLKIIGTLIGGGAALFFLVLLFLPLIFSTQAGKKILLNIIERRSGFHLEVEKLSLSWFGSQNAEGIRAQKPQEQLFLSCGQASCNAPLWKMIMASEIGTLILVDPSIQYAGAFSSSVHLKRLERQTAGLSLPSVQLGMPAIHLPFSGRLVVENGTIAFSPPNLSSIHFDGITLSLEEVQSKTITLDLSCSTHQEQIEGTLSMKAFIEEIDAPLPNGSMQASLTQFPVRGIDQLIALFDPSWGGFAYAALGETVDMQWDMTTQEGDIALDLNAKSPQLTAQIQTQMAKNILSLKSPAALSFTMTPHLFKKLATLFSPLGNLSLEQPSTIEGTLSTFTCPIPLTKEALAKASFNMEMDAPHPWTLSLYTKPLVLNQIHLTANSGRLGTQILLGLDTSLQLETQTGEVSLKGGVNDPFSQSRSGSIQLKSSKLPIDLITIALGNESPLSPFLGNTVDLDASLTMAENDPKLHLSWQSAFLSIPALDLSLKKAWTLLSPAPFTFTCNPEQFKTLSANPLSGTLEQLEIPIDHPKNAKGGFSISTEQLILSGDYPASGREVQAVLQVNGFGRDVIHLQGKLTAAHVSLNPVTLEKVELPFEWDAKTQAAHMTLFATLQNPSGDTGAVQGELNLSNVSFGMDKTLAEATLDLHNFSPLLLEALGASPDLNPLLGSPCNAKIKASSSPATQDVSVEWKSPHLTFDAKFTLNDAGIQLQGISDPIQWVLTKEGYSALDQMITAQTSNEAPFALAETSTFTLSLNKLFIPASRVEKRGFLGDRIPSGGFDLAALKLDASIRNPLLTFIDQKSKETLQLTDLRGTIDTSATQGPLAISIESGVVTQSQSIKNGSFSLSGNLTPISAAVFDPTHLTANLDIKMRQLPSRALDLFARGQGRTDFPFSTTFGTLINANISLDLKDSSGPIAVNVHTPMTQIDMKGHLTNGALLLDAPLYAQMKITPAFSKLIFKEVNPLNLSYLYSQDPITLEIPKEGFYLPLFPSNLSTIAIPHGKIELGKVFCRNEGNVNITLGLLKTKQFDKSGELALWFAPIDLSLKQGIAEIDRTEILLADTFDICLWGNIDLVKEDVDMVLGLTAQTLAKAFGIKGLPENYVLTIPMKGPADNVKINTGYTEVTSRTGFLLARKQTR